jgi:transcription elongation GreA/GreB family factor
MNKTTLLHAITAQIARDLGALMAAARAAHGEATDEQNKAENKYDTRALEASYLAQGQARKAAELEAAREEYAAFVPGKFTAETPLDLGALLALEEAGAETLYFLGPREGGIEVVLGKREVTVITPGSPLGRELVGRRKGEFVVLPNGAKPRRLRIAQVW